MFEEFCTKRLDTGVSARQWLQAAGVSLFAWLFEKKPVWNLRQVVKEPAQNSGDSAVA